MNNDVPAYNMGKFRDITHNFDFKVVDILTRFCFCFFFSLSIHFHCLNNIAKEPTCCRKCIFCVSYYEKKIFNLHTLKNGQ